MEYIGGWCFYDSGAEEITLPSTLNEIDIDAFENCKNLSTVWVEEDWPIRIKGYVREGVEVRYK